MKWFTAAYRSGSVCRTTHCTGRVSGKANAGHHVRVQMPRVRVFVGIDHGVVADAVLDILHGVHGVRGDGRPAQLREQPDLQPPQHLLLGAARLDQQVQGLPGRRRQG